MNPSYSCLLLIIFVFSHDRGVVCTFDSEFDTFDAISGKYLHTLEEEGLDVADIPHSRKKRFLAFHFNSTLRLNLFLTAPISGVQGMDQMTYLADFIFALHDIFPVPRRTTTTAAPTTSTTTPSSVYGAPKAQPVKYGTPKTPSGKYGTPPAPSPSYSSNRIDEYEEDEVGFNRLMFYEHMEQYLDSKGYNGKQCTLRTICEIADAPFDQDVFGELINLIMSASMDPKEAGMYDEYMTAEYYGARFGDCHKIYPKCPESVLGLVSRIFSQ